MPNRYVKHERHGRLDLKKADLGIPGGAELLERLLADRRLPVSTRGVTCAEICETLGFEEPMYLYRRLGRVVASHTRSTAEDRHYGAGESDQHKAYKARAVRAAEEGGHSAVQERPSRDRKIRSDVLIRGADGLLLGFESQLSKVNPRDIAARDAAAQRAGVEDAWQTDSRALAKESVVPWLRTDRQPLELIMKRDSPLPFRGGIRRIDLIRCDERHPGPCPKRRTGKCGGWHPSTRPAERPFDDFIRDAASGLYVRAKVKVKRLAFECWTPTADYDAYLDATAREAPPEVSSQRHARRVMGDGDPTCRVRRPGFDDAVPLAHIPPPWSAPAPRVRSSSLYRGQCGAGVTPCGAPARLYACGWRCDTHKPGATT
ncbi:MULTISPECIES: hypothetical protein [Streptomyces]|uniref:Uncharacterized protein n=3 Tax=Streptomyces rimosus TaxID=1927 RepID=A0A8A1V028_STRR1|nr:MULTISPECIES: hypothetical protein [Streptomyces]MYT42054.1 hypothetical protein [Streptomyces sp. SID5471]QGY70851.1 hypothetical protein V519_037645 [Streptomyces rimosus R6-500]QST86676.1 hypothetical protein SRIM_041430 [Streptomyces rimosus subsp. rimosus ATCC 10970]QTL84479.1 hypothetical protein FMM49_00505 [Streptomyces rimosus subsp. rimosus]QXV92077.1 hypothetical protein M4018_082750 [Streptomyces rimosus]